MQTRVGCVALTAVLTVGCITRPGMNADCEWPVEPATPLDLSKPEELRHLIVDAEVIAELVDRHRFHSSEAQRVCEATLTATVARGHDVTVADVEQAAARIPAKGLNLRVNVPVALLFLYVVLFSVRSIQRRFAGEPIPVSITLVMASVLVSGLFVMVGEFWTSILQMIRVGSFHVGGRVRELPWPRHEREIFLIGVAAFWVVALFRTAALRRVDESPETSQQSAE